MSLIQIQEAVKELTGALNAQIQLTKKIEWRLENLEKRETPEKTTTTTSLTIPKDEQDLKDISRLPDCVKELQVFDGNPTQYISWVHNVENILRDYSIMRDKPIYRAILQHIRQKIRGNADSALISYNIFDEEWTAIKKCLSLHYADKRDLRTLEHQLSNISQRNMTVDEFYATVNHQFSLIVNKIKTEEYSPETINVLAETYRNRTLDVFIRGLNGDLSKMLIIQRPLTLPEAYASCLEIQNLNFRSVAIHRRNITNTITAPINQFTYHRMNSMNQYSYPQTSAQAISTQRRNAAYNIQHQNNPTPPARPANPKPPIPMEVDESLRTRRVDYMNRPTYQPNFKRENSDSNQKPLKQQRVFHMQQQEEEKQYEDHYAEHYTDAEEEESEIEEELTELNFTKEASLAYLT